MQGHGWHKSIRKALLAVDNGLPFGLRVGPLDHLRNSAIIASENTWHHDAAPRQSGPVYVYLRPAVATSRPASDSQTFRRIWPHRRLGNQRKVQPEDSTVQSSFAEGNYPAA